nr:immunoglobulin heavy chain junction region [Mus musculus]NSM03693.1 immunoglobulin heavy chain junction region [Mus musculus]NSM03815.1 immunoglobulin heavy chain junction region [Mus musculus]NSM04095.1 immunoglobulin heavy chain junction region [Mus musculus]NSM04097.1 immunoglobulin heavy chain junction region [Mus musculus]
CARSGVYGSHYWYFDVW